jgi:hypothetical protein
MCNVINFVCVVNDQRWLKDQVNYAADWREQKAAEYPDDDRNEGCVCTLRNLARHLDELPADHPLFRKIALMILADNGLMNEWLDALNGLIPTFGFYKSATSQQLVQQLERVTDRYVAETCTKQGLH